METETTNQVETVSGENPFDGKVTDHSMAWAHVNGAYGISLAIGWRRSAGARSPRNEYENICRRRP